jgi:eukaryotic-like serine/threonine-protein kinase
MEVVMPPERWRKIKELLDEASKRETRDRSAFLNEACGGDEDLKREVQLLLDQDSRTGFLDRPVAKTLSKSDVMQFAAGTRLGQYRIEEHLGMGGMGTVYKATDTTLGREVALKMLHPEMLEDPASVARFEREARTLASLNHQHIGVIYGLEAHDTVRFLALEYVPGPTLAERLRRRALPIREAMLIAQQIAEALEAAHAKGIIHRDLKPANIKLSESGQVKVLDFGLAKSVEQPQTSLSSEITMLTEKLTIAGTPAYMSPEQATGKKVDPRADIWAFGCVLYEMVTGKQAFSGATITEILGAVLEREPDWTALPQASPPPLQYLIKRCLRKDPNSRLRDIGDVRIELEDLLTAPAQSDSGGAPAMITRRTAIGVLSGALAGAVGTGVFAIGRYRDAVPRSLTRFAITAPDPGLLVSSFNRRVAISLDGAYIAFNTSASGLDQLFLRSLAELEPRRIKDVPSGGAAFFSPDGRWVGFLTTNIAELAIKKLALSGGAPVTICPHNIGPAGAAWADDNTIYWVDEIPAGLMSIPADGGQPREIAAIDFAAGERLHKFPCALPGGRAVLSTVTTAETPTFDEARIVAFSPRSGLRKVLLEGGTHPRYSSGHLLYGHDGKILAVRFDPDRLEVQGQPFTVLEGLQMSRNTGVANFDVSLSGDLIFVAGNCDGGARTLVWVDRNGKVEQVPVAAKSYLHPRLSPDDRRLAIEVEGPSHNLYTYDFDRGVLADITTDGVSHWPVWSPDGKQLSYRSGPMGRFTLWHVPADRSQAPQQVPATGVSQSAESWSPDGNVIAYTVAGPGIPAKIMIARLDGNAQAQSVDNEKAPEGSPKFSPDGRWLTYCSNESGKPQVYVQAFPGPGAKIQISNDGGTDPVWKRNGGELYYRNGDSMMAVAVTTAPIFVAGRPQQLWKGHYSHGMSTSCGPPGATSSNYDVTADGKRFVMVKDDDQDRAVSRQIVVCLGWADELRRMDGKA